jgi:hypothetical protein
MGPVTDQWDTELLYSVFEPEDVNEILKIPVRGGMEDMLAWNHDNKGIFQLNLLTALVCIYEMLKQIEMLVHRQTYLQYLRVGSIFGD